MNDFLVDLHANWVVAVAAAAQMAFSLLMVHFVSSYRRFTPLPPVGRFAFQARRFCQLQATLAWLGIFLGAGISCFGILYPPDLSVGTGLNDLGVFVSRVCGPVMMFHALGMAQEFVRAIDNETRLTDALSKMEGRAIEAEAKLAEAERRLAACGCGV